jgi:hypothetical protein
MRNLILAAVIVVALCSVGRGQQPPKDEIPIDPFQAKLGKQPPKDWVKTIDKIVIIGSTRDDEIRAAIGFLFPGLKIGTDHLKKAEEALKPFNAYLNIADTNDARFVDIVIKAQPVLANQKKEPAPGSLEQLIAEALKNNPDIRVADAKVNQAEEEAKRTRMKVVGDISILHAEIESARAVWKEAELRFLRGKELLKRSAISAEDFAVMSLAHAKAKADLAVAEAKLPYLLGRMPGEKAGAPKATAALIDELIHKKWLDFGKTSEINDDEFLRRVTIDILGRTPLAEEIAQFKSMPEKTRRKQWIEKLTQVDSLPATRVDVEKLWQKYLLLPDSPMTDKLRKALDASTGGKFEYGDTAPKVILDNLRDGAFTGINMQVRVKAWKKKSIDIKLPQPVPMGAVLQLLEDELDIAFILRDYGIVVVAADEKLPPGAVRVVDFWKHGKPPEAAPAKKDDTPKTKAAKADGVVSKVNGDLVEISIGSENGVEKNHTFDLFRLGEKRWLGRIRVIEVMPTRAVGKLLPSALADVSVRAGDQVSRDDRFLGR